MEYKIVGFKLLEFGTSDVVEMEVVVGAVIVGF